MTSPALAELAINAELVTRILVGFLRSEIRRTGFQKAVFGLSGGVDSSVVAYLLAEALGPENVLAVCLPYKTSSDETRAHSKLVIRNLGLPSVEIPITRQIDAYFQHQSDVSTLRLANKCARERMTVLYDQSAAVGGLVVGTSNKSELLLGYGTQHGDLASAVNPIGDLYKTQLRELGRHLQVPDEILDKAPSGDLWVGQTDEDELGFTYDEVDRLLVLMVDRRWHRDELIDAGFSERFVDDVRRRIRVNQFKRRMPVIAKLSHRTVDTDFRYPRDWGT